MNLILPAALFILFVLFIFAIIKYFIDLKKNSKSNDNGQANLLQLFLFIDRIQIDDAFSTIDFQKFKKVSFEEVHKIRASFGVKYPYEEGNIDYQKELKKIYELQTKTTYQKLHRYLDYLIFTNKLNYSLVKLVVNKDFDDSAIKDYLKKNSISEESLTALKEFKSHENIVKLKELFNELVNENGQYFIFSHTEFLIEKNTHEDSKDEVPIILVSEYIININLTLRVEVAIPNLDDTNSRQKYFFIHHTSKSCFLTVFGFGKLLNSKKKEEGIVTLNLSPISIS